MPGARDAGRRTTPRRRRPSLPSVARHHRRRARDRRARRKPVACDPRPPRQLGLPLRARATRWHRRAARGRAPRTGAGWQSRGWWEAAATRPLRFLVGSSRGAPRLCRPLAIAIRRTHRMRAGSGVRTALIPWYRMPTAVLGQRMASYLCEGNGEGAQQGASIWLAPVLVSRRWGQIQAYGAARRMCVAVVVPCRSMCWQGGWI